MRDVRVRPYPQRREGVSDKDIRAAKKAEHERQRGFTGAMVGPEEFEQLQRKLSPRRFPGMSGRMAAIVGYVLDKRWTDPYIDEMAVTSDGYVLASRSNDVGMNEWLGPLSDLERNWENLLVFVALDMQFGGG